MKRSPATRPNRRLLQSMGRLLNRKDDKTKPKAERYSTMRDLMKDRSR